MNIMNISNIEFYILQKFYVQMLIAKNYFLLCRIILKVKHNKIQ